VILRFLRFFPQFRALEASQLQTQEELAAANTQLQVWQDRVEQGDREVSFLREQMSTAVAKERYTYQSWLNFQVQPTYGVAPFPDAAVIPQDARFSEPPETGSGGRQYMSPSTAVAMQTKNFMRKSAEKLAFVEPIR
jgi:hypothetical protein